MTDVTDTDLAYRWTQDEFVRAWSAGVFDQRVELVDGEVWPVVIGSWHGDTTGRVTRTLPNGQVVVTTSTLPTGDSLLDPDCWVRPADAAPASSIGPALDVWRPEDVLLVVEVSHETVVKDLNQKARLYGRGGYAVYWVVTADVIYEHTEPTSNGYRVRVEHSRGDRIPVRYAGTDLAVDDLIPQR